MFLAHGFGQEVIDYIGYVKSYVKWNAVLMTEQKSMGTCTTILAISQWYTWSKARCATYNNQCSMLKPVKYPTLERGQHRVPHHGLIILSFSQVVCLWQLLILMDYLSNNIWYTCWSMIRICNASSRFQQLPIIWE